MTVLSGMLSARSLSFAFVDTRLLGAAGLMSVLSLTLRRTLRLMLPSDLPSFVVASFGRSGSSMLQDVVASGLASRRFGTSRPFFRKACAGAAWDLRGARFERGVTYKTHDYPHALKGRDAAKAIFIFGSAVDAARSAYVLGRRERAWMRGHAQNLKRPGVAAEDLLQRDALGFLDQARAWSNFTGVPTLCVRFEEIWDRVDRLREFTGLPLVLPPRRERTSKVVPPDVEKKLRATFEPVDAVLDELPAVRIHR